MRCCCHRAPSGGVDFACALSGVTGAPATGETAVCQAIASAPACFGVRLLGGPGMAEECGECAARCCGANQKVVANQCVACEAGSTNDAGDDANGVDTQCDPTPCPANTYVDSNGCAPCSAGKVRQNSSPPLEAPLALFFCLVSLTSPRLHCATPCRPAAPRLRRPGRCQTHTGPGARPTATPRTWQPWPTRCAGRRAATAARSTPTPTAHATGARWTRTAAGATATPA
eukprot:SAG22_NODE_257_length_13543_cov_26.100417_4_plen_229_part_00